MITINATNIPIKVDEHKKYKMNLYKKELIANHVKLAYKVSNDVYFKTYPRQRGIHTRKDINSVGLHGLVRAAQSLTRSWVSSLVRTHIHGFIGAVKIVCDERQYTRNFNFMKLHRITTKNLISSMV